MDIADLLTPTGVIANLRVINKRQALQELAKRASALSGRHERAIFDVLLERERLGTTGIGMGTAVPHGRLADAEPGNDSAHFRHHQGLLRVLADVVIIADGGKHVIGRGKALALLFVLVVVAQAALVAAELLF